MTRDDIHALMSLRRKAFADRNLDALGALYAEDAELESPLAGSVRGREAVMASVGAFLTSFPNAVFTEEDPLIDGDRVAILAEVSGTDVGGIMGLPPSGRPFRFLAATALQVRGNLIVHEQRVYDFTGLLVQVGALKAKPA